MEAEKCVCRTASPSPEIGRVYNCVDCASLGWCSQQGSPSLSRIPSIDSNGLLVRAGAGISTTQFFEEVKDTPKRTRLDAITPWLERKRKGLVDRLEDINEMLLLYGLEARRIYNEGEVTKDEPLIICTRYWSPRAIELDECAHRHPIRSSEGMWWADRNNEEEFERLRDVLVGGYRPQQEQAIRDSLATPGSLLIAALPTGFGKTRIGQVITWLNRRRPNGSGGPTLLISPLIALMDDQREQYRRFNEVLETNGFSPLKTYFLTAAEESNYSEMMQKLKNNEVDVICCSPETILNPVGKSHWVEVFLQMKKPFSTMIVDEAHMIGEWGASIRPEFQLLGWVKDRLLDRDGGLRVLLMSATITESEERELKKLFKRGLKTLDVVREDRIREDLSFNVVVEGDSEEESSEEWVSFLTSQRSLIPSRWFKEQASRPDAFGRPPLLIYTPTVKFANGALKGQVRDILCDGKKKLVKTYYGDTPSDRKDVLRKQFVDDEFRALIATSAFGMGIDKGDVWTIAYLGMPYSLKGLYQAFGRAARKSNWPMIEEKGLDISRSELRSGNCLGVIPEGKDPRPFKRQLGKKKTMERIWDMFILSPETKITTNGYAIVPVVTSGHEKAYWNPTGATLSEEDVEEEDTSDSWSIDQILAERSFRDNQERLREMGRQKRRKALFQYNMWTIACLQRTDKVEFMGLHPLILSRSRSTGKDVTLFDALEDKGYDSLLEHNHKGSNSQYVPKGQQRYAVLRFRKSLMGLQDLEKMTMEGHAYLHERHGMGRKELKKFISQVSGKVKRTIDGRVVSEEVEKLCVRKALAPAIGVKSSDIKACIEAPEGSLLMPCNNCREKLGFSGLRDSGFLWSDSGTVSKILGEKVIEEKVKLSRARMRQMRNMVLKNDIEGIIERTMGDDMIPSRLTQGTLRKTGGEYNLFSMKGEKITKWLAVDKGGFAPSLGVRWPIDATGIIIWKGEARIVGSSVYEGEFEDNEGPQ